MPRIGTTRSPEEIRYSIVVNMPPLFVFISPPSNAATNPLASRRRIGAGTIAGSCNGVNVGVIISAHSAWNVAVKVPLRGLLGRITSVYDSVGEGPATE